MFYNDNRYNSECYKPLYILYDIISKYIGQNFPKIKKKMDESIVLVGYIYIYIFLMALFKITRSSCQSEDVETLSNQ